MRVATFVFAIVVAIQLTPSPLRAHHSFAAEYDGKKPIQLQGVVTKIDWENPHVYLYIDVKDESGNSVTGWRSKDDTDRIAGREVTLPDGKKLFLGPPSE
jgi:hypothetical protein